MLAAAETALPLPLPPLLRHLCECLHAAGMLILAMLRRRAVAGGPAEGAAAERGAVVIDGVAADADEDDGCMLLLAALVLLAGETLRRLEAALGPSALDDGFSVRSEGRRGARGGEGERRRRRAHLVLSSKQGQKKQTKKNASKFCFF